MQQFLVKIKHWTLLVETCVVSLILSWIKDIPFWNINRHVGSKLQMQLGESFLTCLVEWKIAHRKKNVKYVCNGNLSNPMEIIYRKGY